MQRVSPSPYLRLVAEHVFACYALRISSHCFIDKHAKIPLGLV
jgi:hypothetical protein